MRIGIWRENWTLAAVVAATIALAACGAEPEEPARAGVSPISPVAPTPSAAPMPPTATAVLAPSPDRDELIALYNASDGANWARNDNWLSDRCVPDTLRGVDDNDFGETGLPFCQP